MVMVNYKLKLDVNIFLSKCFDKVYFLLKNAVNILFLKDVGSFNLIMQSTIVIINSLLYLKFQLRHKKYISILFYEY